MVSILLGLCDLRCSVFFFVTRGRGWLCLWCCAGDLLFVLLFMGLPCCNHGARGHRGVTCLHFPKIKRNLEGTFELRTEKRCRLQEKSKRRGGRSDVCEK